VGVEVTVAGSSDPYILAVDDETGFRTLYQRLLEPAGYRVRTASDAAEALRIFSEDPPAVAILDIHMPGHDGLWLADQIRARGMGTAMILATSDSAVPPIASMKPGIVAYLVKPYDARTLRTAVDQAMSWRGNTAGHAAPLPDPSAPGVASSAAATARAAASRAEPVYAAPAQTRYPARESGGDQRSAGSSNERMLLWALVALLTAALVGAIVWYFTMGRQDDLLSRVSAASGVVRTLGPTGKVLMQGSGFFVAPDVFVTAHHVVKDGTGARIEGAGHVVYRAEGVVGVNREQDLVLLRTTPASAAQLTIAESPPAVGEKIAVYGAPLGLAGTLSTGIVSAQSPSSRLQISAPISPGSSGSPVIDARGSVVGVVVASRTAGQALNFAVPAPFVQRLLRAVGPVRPFVTVARGAGDDRERHELIGPVRLVTVTAEVQDATIVDEFVAHGGASAGAVRLSFDQLGRLIEREEAAAGTTAYFTHDEQGRVKSEVVRQGNATTGAWDYMDISGRRMRAVDLKNGIARTAEYADDGRLLSEEIRHGGETRLARAWAYGTPGWPGVPASAVSAGDVQVDAFGNVTVHRLASGAELRHRYTFDDHGNWVLRETVRHAGGQDLPVRRDRRVIEYWE